jgi:hypothetical protein
MSYISFDWSEITLTFAALPAVLGNPDKKTASVLKHPSSVYSLKSGGDDGEHVGGAQAPQKGFEGRRS